MRRLTLLGLVLVLNGWWLVSPGYAQRGEVARGSVGRASAFAGEPDLLSPYGTHQPAGFAATRKGYTRPAAPPRLIVPDRVARPSVHAQGVSDYFPMMRPGVNPNRNVVDPRSLCVPGRRALLVR